MLALVKTLCDAVKVSVKEFRLQLKGNHYHKDSHFIIIGYNYNVEIKLNCINNQSFIYIK